MSNQSKQIFIAPYVASKSEAHVIFCILKIGAAQVLLNKFVTHSGLCYI